MKTRVVNLRSEPYDVYIGRAGKGKDGYFGNPLLIGAKTRDQVIKEFDTYMRGRFAKDPEYRKRIMELKGKTLGCFCKPLACHGDVIVALLEGESK